MRTPSTHQDQVLYALLGNSSPGHEAITVKDAIALCQVSDIEQIAWEVNRAGIKVSALALLAMALSRAIVRKVAEQYALKGQLKQAKIAVTRTGDKGKH